VLVALLAVLALVVLLRAFNVGHVLTYDEAWNANSIVDVATGNSDDPFHSNFTRHPPFYTGLGVVYALTTGSGRYGVATAMQVFSLLCAVGLALMLFICGREWFGEWTGVAAALLFAVMPAARAFDTLVKQESLTLLLGLLFLFLFFREKYVAAGAFLGLAALTKEIFIFVPAALLLYMLATRGWLLMKGFLVSVGISALMSAWWYLILSTSRGEFLDFFLGRSSESMVWKQPWYFFLVRLPKDLGVATLLLAAAGCAFFLLEAAKHRRHAEPVPTVEGDGGDVVEGGGATDWRRPLLPTIWILVTYAFLSLSLGKPPWLIYAALPAFALLGGWGLTELYRVLEARRRAAALVVALVVLCAVLLAVPFGFETFLKDAERYENSLAYKKVADYMNARVGRAGRVMMRLEDFSPNIAFYLDGYSPGAVRLLTLEPDDTAPEDFEILLLEGGAGLGEAVSRIESEEPDLVMVRPGFKSDEGEDLAAGLAGLALPDEIDGVWVFDGREVVEALRGTGQ
jgi:4-amino-4-deoxy-L-arabinose transferase-like glycosyltransferase